MTGSQLDPPHVVQCRIQHIHELGHVHKSVNHYNITLLPDGEVITSPIKTDDNDYGNKL